MQREQEHTTPRDDARAPRAASWMFLFVAASGCGGAPGPAARVSESVVVRVGVGRLPAQSPLNGLRQLVQTQSIEGLVRFDTDGRPRPWLAKDWTVAPDGLSMRLRLRPEARFHDGSTANGQVVATALRDTLPGFMGPAFQDVARIDAVGDFDIDIRFKRPSPFLLEALEAAITKPGAATIGTGPFMADPDMPNELRANLDYYLGPPTVSRIVMKPYLTVRAAWADMLRDNIDMLHEVGPDALSSMQGARTAAVFSFTRHYQYLVFLNVKSPQLRDPAVRRALNWAVDRAELVRQALDSHGTPSSGPVWPGHWAVNNDVTLATNLQLAANTLAGKPLRFVCLVPPDYERIALVIKRQLAAVGVDMNVEQTETELAIKAMSTSSFEAVLLEVVGGPSLLRPYAVWHQGGSINPGAIGSPAVDAALDRIRYAASDDEYRAAVSHFQQVAIDDPPAIFLAWSERARAVSTRFVVPVIEPGRDVLATLRLWRPATAAEQRAGRN
jgi:ABC-type transport system substrate-binding protein